MNGTVLYEVAFPYLGIEIEKLNRVAFSVFGFDVYWYGIILGLGVIAGLLYGIYEAKATGQNPDLYYDFLFYIIFVCIIGSRIYYVIFSWDMYKDDLLQIFNLRQGGIAIYGTVIAGAIGAFVYTRIKKLNFWLFADTCAPALIIGQAIGRWGNFVNREIFGGYTESILAMRYLYDQVDIVPDSVASNLVLIGGASYIQVHPTFLYESLCCLIIFIFMNLYKRHKRFHGEILAIYFIGYGITRAIIEGIRTDQLFIWNTNIPVSQVVSIILIALGILILIIPRKQKYKSSQADDEANDEPLIQ